MQKHLQSGMSFIEISIVILIMGIMAAVIATNMTRWLSRGKDTATKASLQSVSNVIQEYQMDVGAYPNALVDLVTKPQDVTGWNGAYLKKVPKDGWNQEFIYKKNERGTQPPYELYSMGDPAKEDGRIYAE